MMANYFCPHNMFKLYTRLYNKISMFTSIYKDKEQVLINKNIETHCIRMKGGQA